MKRIKELSLILSGVILGIGILYAPTIYAATSSLLGTKVDKVMTVKLDNKKIGDAVVINGTSYLPVRATADAFNAGVNVNSSEINLTSEPAMEQSETERLIKVNGEKFKIGQKIKNKKLDIAGYEYNISYAQTRLDEYKRRLQENLDKQASIQAEIDRYQADIDLAKASIKKANEELADLETQLATLK